MKPFVGFCISLFVIWGAGLECRTLFTADSYYPRFKRHNLNDTARNRTQKTKPVMNFFGESQIVVDKAHPQNETSQNVDTAVDFVVQECHNTINQLRREKRILEEKISQLTQQLVDCQKQKASIELRKEKEKNSRDAAKIFHDREENKRFKSELKDAKSALISLRKKYNVAQKNLQQKGDLAGSLHDEVEQLKNEMGVLQRTDMLLNKDVKNLKNMQEQVQIKTVEIQQLHDEIKELNVQCADYNKKLKEAARVQLQLSKKEEESAQLEEEIRQLKDEIKSLNVNHQKCKKDMGKLKDLQKITEENKRLRGQNKMLDADLKSYKKIQITSEKNGEQLKNEIAKKNEEEAQLHVEIQQLQGEIKELSAQHADYNKKLKEAARVQLQLSKKEEESAQLEEEIRQLKGEIKSLNVNHQKCKKDMGKLKDLQKITEENKRLRGQNKMLDADLKSYKKIQITSEKNGEQLKNEITKKNKEEAQLHVEIQQLEEEVRQLKDEIKSLNADCQKCKKDFKRVSDYDVIKKQQELLKKELENNKIYCKQREIANVKEKKEVANLQKELHALNKVVDQKEASLEKMKKEREEKDRAYAASRQEVKNARALQKAAEQRMQNAEKRAVEFKKEYTVMQDSVLQTHMDRLTELKREIEQKDKEITRLRAGVDPYLKKNNKYTDDIKEL